MSVSEPKANESHFHFICSDMDKSTFEVLEFSGVEAISRYYEFEITLLSKKVDIDLEKVIYKPATLFIGGEGHLYPYSGIIAEFMLIDRGDKFNTYQAILAPHLLLASLNTQSRVMVKTKFSDAVKKVLQETNVSNFKIDTGSIKNDTEFEYLVQYEESDLNFISRLMEDAGVWFLFDEKRLTSVGNSEESLSITGASNAFTSIEGPGEIPYKEKSGLEGEISINQFQARRKISSANVVVKNYNYRNPDSDLVGKSKVENGTTGSVYEYGGALKDISAVQNAAEVLSNRINSHSIEYYGSGNCAGFRAGRKFKINQTIGNSSKVDEYVLTQVTHQGGHHAGIATYRNSFSCIPSTLAAKYAPEKHTMVPKVPGILTAKIEADGDEYATLDEKGRYKVKLHFDMEKTQNLDASKYMRLAQPYSGAQYGIHFPSHKDTEMLVACVNGDPNKPIGIGTIPNANTLPPVVSGNKQQGIIRTAGGNELLMDDTDSKQKIHLLTKAKNFFEMDDENFKISTISNAKNSIVIDDKNKFIKITSKAHVVIMSYADDSNITISTEKGNIIKLDDANKKIGIQTPGGHKIDMDDNSKKICLEDGQGKNTVTLDGQGGLILDSKGKIEIKAKQDLVIEAANIQMKSKGKIEQTATTDYKMKGMNLEAKGDVGVKVNGGTTLELKGGASGKLEATMLEINGSAMTKVKGGIVMIN